MIETYIRPIFQKYCVTFLAMQLAQTVNPLHITILSAIFGISVPILLKLQHSYLAILMLLVSGYCDTLDGTIARMQSNCTQFGAVLDIICDRIVEFSAIFGLYLIDPINRSLVSMCMLGSILLCITSFLVVGIFIENNSDKSFHYNPGLMERAEAFTFFIAMILLPKYFNLLGTTFIILVLWTAIYRIIEFKDKGNCKAVLD